MGIRSFEQWLQARETDPKMSLAVSGSVAVYGTNVASMHSTLVRISLQVLLYQTLEGCKYHLS